MTTWEEAISAVRVATRDACAASKYGQVDYDAVRDRLADDIDDRQTKEALRYLKDLGDVRAYFDAEGVVDIRWRGEF